MSSNINLSELFNKAENITRGSAEPMGEGWKCYADKVAIKHKTLNGGEKVLVRITKDAVIFTPSDKGNRTLTSKGTDGRVILSLNAQMKKVLASAFNNNKDGNKCHTLKLEMATENKQNYYVLKAQAERV